MPSTRSGLIIGEGLLVVPEIEQAADKAPPYGGLATSGFARSEARMRGGSRCHLHRKVRVCAPARQGAMR